MNTICDDDLVLYHYRDGLTAGELAAIAQALRDSAALRARYAALCATLQAVDAQPVPSADAGLEERLWQRWEQQVGRGGVPDRRHADALRGARRTPHRAGARSLRRYAATAFAVIVALGAGILIGRQPALPQEPAPPPEVTAVGKSALSSRVLDAYVAAHLRETEGVVLTAINSDSAALLAGNRELAAGLIDSNRLYAQAAARSGNARLANFLQQLEPLLIELANPAGTESVQSTDGLRDHVDKTDLLFQLRATQARIEPQRPTTI